MTGALQLLERADIDLLVVCDVLSFSTTVSIATSRGISIVPAAPGEEAELAAALGAQLAGRSRQADEKAPWTLSPAAMASAPSVDTVVVASPNGAAISATAVRAGVSVLAGSLRNAAAVARYVAESPGPVGVIAAGERWADGELRPAIEDDLAAGLFCRALLAVGFELEAEAELSARAVVGLNAEAIGRLVTASHSGRELFERGFGDDVRLATELDGDALVPLLTPAAAGFLPAR